MQFIVLSGREIKHYNIEEVHIVISITSPSSKHPELPIVDSRIGLLQLKFYDLDERATGYSLFTKEQASAILNFFNYYKSKISTVICQCEAGISRSSAVAAALAKSIGQSDEKFFKYYLPNRYVYRTILEESTKGGENESKSKDFEESI